MSFIRPHTNNLLLNLFENNKVTRNRRFRPLNSKKRYLIQAGADSFIGQFHLSFTNFSKKIKFFSLLLADSPRAIMAFGLTQNRRPFFYFYANRPTTAKLFFSVKLCNKYTCNYPRYYSPYTEYSVNFLTLPYYTKLRVAKYSAIV